MIPFSGWASTGGKFVNKGDDLYQARNVVSTEKMESVYSPIYQDVVNSPLTDTPMKKDEPWDMGHKPGFEFRKHQ